MPMVVPSGNKKGGAIAGSPFVDDSIMLKLELISPVQITVCPVSTAPGSAVLINPEVFLDRGRQIARVIPK